MFARRAAMNSRGTGRLRSAWARVRRRAPDRPDMLDGTADDLGTLWTGSRGAGSRAEARDRDLELVRALTRVADTFSRIADGLDSDRRERRAQFEADRRDRRTQLDAVEYLLREMAIGVGGATAVPPTVVGGSIEPDGPGPRELDTVDVDLTDLPIELDAPVEVRSRFHDGWVRGFTVADYVRGADGNGYRLRREAETDPLPMRYDPADVRRAGATSELPPPSPRRSLSDG